MKLNTATRNIESSGMNLHVDFAIDMNGKAFSVLSEGMYSDIVGTIVRELSSNAYDSHVAAGKANVPFEVSCPSGLDPYFSVKDFGTGLRYFSYTGQIENLVEGESTIKISGDIRRVVEGINTIVLNGNQTANISAVLFDTNSKQTVLRVAGDFEGDNIQVEFDDALVLYSTYFRSTKEQSNDYIGAFGLGSKTPFAYTDNFLVINRFNGVERTYNILTNKDSKPQINLMGSTTTDDSNGLEVKIAIDPSDYSAFREAISEQLRFFNPLPEIQNDEVSFNEIKHWGEHIVVVDNLPDRGYWGKVFVCVGNNCYKIERSNGRDLFAKMPVALRFNVGDVMVTASRESLKDDDDTRAAIKKKVDLAQEEYKRYLIDSIKGQNLTDEEKAILVNDTREYLRLNEKQIREFISDPHYCIDMGKLYKPLSGWGTYTEIKYVTFEDSTGNTNYNVQSCGNIQPLSWWGYATTYGGNPKTESVSNLVVFPGAQLPTIFVKDNSYAFLKKVAYYLNENGMSKHNVYIVSGKDEKTREAALDAIKEAVSKDIKIVYISTIELPTTASTSIQYTSNTPVARKIDGVFYRLTDNPMGWTDEYTPLTQIDTDSIECFAVPIHRTTVEHDAEELRNLRTALEHAEAMNINIDKSGFEIYGIPRAKYEKALGYGFKPLSELIEFIDEQIKIPLKVLNKHWYKDVYEHISELNLIHLFRLAMFADRVKDITNENFLTLLRFFKIYEDRYDCGVAGENMFDEKNFPEIPEKVKKNIDKLEKMLYSVEESMILVSGFHKSDFYYDDDANKKKDALIEYINSK